MLKEGQKPFYVIILTYRNSFFFIIRICSVYFIFFPLLVEPSQSSELFLFEII